MTWRPNPGTLLLEVCGGLLLLLLEVAGGRTEVGGGLLLLEGGWRLEVGGSWELGFGARECRHIYVGGEWNWEDQGTPDKICNSIAYIFLICMQLRVVRSIRTTKHLGLAHISLESALSRLGARELSFFLKLNIAFYIWNLLDKYMFHRKAIFEICYYVK